MGGIEERIVKLIKQLEEERRLADKRAKQLYQEAIKTTAKARAYRNGDQLNISSGVFTKVELNAESFDPGNDFDVSNYKYVAPAAGCYLMIGQVTWSSVVNGKRYIAALYVNDGQVAIPGAHSGSVNALTSRVSDIREVGSGQSIELFCWHNSGVDTVDIVGGATQTFLAVHLLSK
jgi:hypothetical protein